MNLRVGMEFGIIRPAMKIIHTSDWHLGARLHEEDRSAEHVAFIDWLLDQIKTERPDALLVSGDVFDTTAPSASALKAYHSFVVRAYSEAGCQNIVITGGNHDSPSWLGMSRQILECVGTKVVPAGEDEPERECVVVERDGHPVLAIAAIPYLRESELANLVRQEDDPRSHDELVRAGFAEHCRRVVAAARAKAGDAPVVMMGHCVISGSRLSDDVSERQRGVVSDTVVGGVKSVDFAMAPDAMLVFGLTAGRPIDDSLISRAKKVTDTPVFASNGVKSSTVERTLSIADGCVVGTSLKYNGSFYDAVDRDRVKELMDNAKRFRGDL